MEHDDNDSIWMVMAAVLITAALVLSFMLALSIRAHAHSWYPYECCSDKDCEVLDADKVRVEPDGYHLPNGSVVAHNKIRFSPDGQFHWCRYGGTGGVIRPTDQQVCLWVPGGGT
jgi:hypothetical protein